MRFDFTVTGDYWHGDAFGTAPNRSAGIDSRGTFTGSYSHSGGATTDIWGDR